MCLKPLAWRCGASAADEPWGGVPDHFFGLKSIVPSRCDFGGARCAHDGAKVAPRCPKWAPRVTFGGPLRHFWRPKWRNAVCTKNILFTMF